MSHKAVNVVFLCPEDPDHTLGMVSRQVVAVPESAAGREICVPVQGGLEVLEFNATLVGQCPTCRAGGSRWRPQLSWPHVQKLLDAAEASDSGVLTVPLRI